MTRSLILLRLLTALLLGLALALAVERPAGAHAVIDNTDPVAGSVVETPPDRVTLYLTEALEAGFSKVMPPGAQPSMNARSR